MSPTHSARLGCLYHMSKHCVTLFQRHNLPECCIVSLHEALDLGRCHLHVSSQKSAAVACSSGSCTHALQMLSSRTVLGLVFSLGQLYNAIDAVFVGILLYYIGQRFNIADTSACSACLVGGTYDKMHCHPHKTP